MNEINFFDNTESDSEIKFFESSEIYDRPHDSNHQACSTPNPPWWCDESDDQPIGVGIDLYLPILILVGFIIAILKIKK